MPGLCSTGSRPRRFVIDASPLDERSRAILEFENGWWMLPGSKARAIRERFGLSAARYYRLLNRLLDSPEALSHDPLLVRRLRRLRAARRRVRYEGAPSKLSESPEEV
jgi:Protein of unknown function (DUF3263)